MHRKDQSIKATYKQAYRLKRAKLKMNIGYNEVMDVVDEQYGREMAIAISRSMQPIPGYRWQSAKRQMAFENAKKEIENNG